MSWFPQYCNYTHTHPPVLMSHSLCFRASCWCMTSPTRSLSTTSGTGYETSRRSDTNIWLPGVGWGGGSGSWVRHDLWLEGGCEGPSSSWSQSRWFSPCQDVSVTACVCVCVLQHAASDVERMVLGNKCDMNDKRQVSKERGEKVREMIDRWQAADRFKINQTNLYQLTQMQTDWS